MVEALVQSRALSTWRSSMPCVCPTEQVYHDNWETVDQEWQTRSLSPGRLERDCRRKDSMKRSKGFGHVRMRMICALDAFLRESAPVHARL